MTGRTDFCLYGVSFLNDQYVEKNSTRKFSICLNHWRDTDKPRSQSDLVSPRGAG
jgi:hypothetical protein